MTLRQWLRTRRNERRIEARARKAKALPDGTRVRLACGPGCGFAEHDGVWLTSWTPRRTRDPEDPDDYMLTRESDGKTTYARRNVLEVLPG